MCIPAWLVWLPKYVIASKDSGTNQIHWHYAIVSGACSCVLRHTPPYTQQNSLFPVRLAETVGPRGECSVWKVSQWGNGLHQAVGNRILTLFTKICDRSAADALDSIWWGNVSWSEVFEWHHRFKEGHDLLENDLCSRWPATSQNCGNMRLVQILCGFFWIQFLSFTWQYDCQVTPQFGTCI